MVVSPKCKKGYQVRSISLPCRSHPATAAIEEELNKIKAWESSPKPSSAETIRDGLYHLSQLYISMDALLNSSSLTQKSLSSHQNMRWVDELIDGSVKFLDICDTTRDIASQMKEHIRDLQCALRRRKGDFSVESSIGKYVDFRKKMKKDAKALIMGLKRSVDNNKIFDGGFLVEVVTDSDHHRHHMKAVIRVLIEVSEMTVSVLESLLLYFSIPKPSKWSLVSKLIHKGTVACEDHQQLDGRENEIKGVDAALLDLSRAGVLFEVEKLKIAQRRLEGLEGQIESIEDGLDYIFRRLIGARAALLNIISQ